MSVITCSGVALPTPAYEGYSAISEELTQADRNVLGLLIKKRIAIKHTIDLEWHAISASEKNSIISSTDANSFTATFLSLMDDSTKSGMFYRGSSPEIKGYGKFDGKTFQYYDVKISLVEFRCTPSAMPTRRRSHRATTTWTPTSR